MSDPRGVATEVVARAPGRLNLFLAVGEREPAHARDLATALQAVSLYDDVTARAAETFTLTMTIDGQPVPPPMAHRNVALRAARLLASKVDVAGGVALHIDKRLPINGGLGGGAANAAGALVACNALWGAGLEVSKLQEVAIHLGTDATFALKGGTAIGTDNGDQLSAALAAGSFTWVLVLFDEGLPVATVFNELDEHRARHRFDIGPRTKRPVVDPVVLAALRAGDSRMLAEVITNDLQVAALHLRPELADVLELGERAGALAGIVSGSGPTIAFLVEDAHAGERVASVLRSEGHRTETVTSPVTGARVLAER